MGTRINLRVFWTAAIVVCVTAALSQVSFANSYARIVRLSDLGGQVQIDRNTGQGFEKAIMNMPVTQGVRLQTGPSGRAEVEFENGTALRLAENTSVQFSDLSLRSDGQRVSDVRLNDGMVYVNFKRKGGDDFRLNVGNETLNVDHDVHFRVRLVNGGGEIAVLKGELEVPSNGQIAKIKKGETLNLDLNDSSRDVLAKNITSLGSDQWDAERTDYNSEYASNFNHSHYPYQYGYSDLNYYGSFFDAPGYGMLWRPFGMSAMWDPFADGAWAYYPGAGYMWVSGYPWGWTPYRYGTWLYVPAYGWAWQPGGWNTFNAYPVVMNPPATWHRPLPPTTTVAARPTVIVGTPAYNRPVRAMGMPVRGMMPGATAFPGNTSSSAAGNTPSASRPGRSQAPAAQTHSAPPPRPMRTGPPPSPMRMPEPSMHPSAPPAGRPSKH